MDERQWLLGTSYNTGIECLQYTASSFTSRVLTTKLFLQCFISGRGTKMV